MHSRIFQISREPISKDEYISEADFYDNGFIGNIADYVSDDTDRESDIEWLKQRLEGVADFNGDSFTIKDQRKYFEKSFSDFLEAIKDISLLTFEDFCTDANDFNYKMYKLESAYRDEFEFYINDIGGYGTEPFDDFMRRAKNGDVLYIGATLDYHF